MVWGSFSAAEAEQLVLVDAKLEKSKYWVILEENILEAVKYVGHLAEKQPLKPELQRNGLDWGSPTSVIGVMRCLDVSLFQHTSKKWLA